MLRRPRLRPAVCGFELENRHSFDRKIVRTAVRIDPCQAGVLDAELFFQQRDLLGQTIQITQPPRPNVGAAHYDASGVHNGRMGQGEYMEDGCFDTVRPVLWQR